MVLSNDVYQVGGDGAVYKILNKIHQHMLKIHLTGLRVLKLTILLTSGQIINLLFEDKLKGVFKEL